MDGEKKYKEALERAKAIYQGSYKPDTAATIAETLQNIFPELEESEDERIRKEIIDYIKIGTYHKNWIGWLEKQGEQKLTDKVKSKFKVGDWVVNNQTSIIYLVKSIRDNEYCLWCPLDAEIEGFLRIVDVDSECHLWTIQDAKDGDVLQLGEVTAIFKEFIGNNNCKCYCSVYNGEFEIPSKNGADNSYGCYNATPATKEQRDTLFAKMKKAGYEWDAEKKELSPIKLRAGQVLKHDNLSVLCLGGRNAVKCNGEPFVIQYPDEWIEVYGEEYDKFFTRLQSSGYYYDFLHNQVKENCSTLWVARDFDGALAVFTNRPVLTKSKNRWIDLTDKNDFFSILPEYYYPKVTFENSPLQLFHL